MQLYDSDEYRASKDWPYAISAGCVVYRKNVDSSYDLLLLMRDFDHDYFSAGDTNKPSYHLPKGHLHFNEALEEAALRETQEELGAEAEITTYLGAIHHTFNHPKHQNSTDKEVHYFAARWVQDVQKTDNEHDSRSWVPLAKAEQLLGAPNPKEEDELVRRFKKYVELTSAT